MKALYLWTAIIFFSVAAYPFDRTHGGDAGQALPLRGGNAEREEKYTPVNVPFIFLENLFPWPAASAFKELPGFSKGSLTYMNFTHFDDTPQDERRVRNEYLLELQYEKKFGDKLRLLAIPEVYFDDDAMGRGVMDELADDNLRRNVFNFQEFYLDVYLDKVDLRLGKQIFAWGKADELNPTDNLGAEDLQDLFHDRDIGVLAARLNYYVKDYQVEVALVPFFTPTRLPMRDSRFSLISQSILIPVKEPLLPDKTIENMQWGVRLLRTVRGWDFSLGYYDGIYHLPVVRFVPFVGLQPLYNRMRVIGGDFATQFGKLGLRGETGYFLFDGRLDDDYVQYVFGVDYTFSDVIGDQDLYILLQYVGEGVTDEGDLLLPGAIGSPGRALSQAITMDLSYEFTEFLKAILDLIYLTEARDSFLLRPKVEYGYSDRLSLALSFDLPQGEKSTFFGQFRNSQRLFVSMKYSF